MKFQKEALTNKLLCEAMPLLYEHWREVAHYQDIPLHVDVERYLENESLGVLRTFTARDEDGKLLGYAVFVVGTNAHYKDSLQANQDVIFVDKSARGGTGYRFIKFCDEELRAEGVQVVYQHIKKAHNFGVMLERIGYELVDLIYARRLN